MRIGKFGRRHRHDPEPPPAPDPFAPQRAGGEAIIAFERRDFDQAFLSYVEAVDRLHDAFVTGGFRVRRPLVGDSLVLEGLLDSLRAIGQPLPEEIGVARARVAGKLREIIAAIEAIGGDTTQYRLTLRALYPR